MPKEVMWWKVKGRDLGHPALSVILDDAEGAASEVKVDSWTFHQVVKGFDFDGELGSEVQ